jgi:hypothetical protein
MLFYSTLLFKKLTYGSFLGFFILCLELLLVVESIGTLESSSVWHSIDLLEFILLS